MRSLWFAGRISALGSISFPSADYGDVPRAIECFDLQRAFFIVKPETRPYHMDDMASMAFTIEWIAVPVKPLCEIVGQEVRNQPRQDALAGGGKPPQVGSGDAPDRGDVIGRTSEGGRNLLFGATRSTDRERRWRIPLPAGSPLPTAGRS